MDGKQWLSRAADLYTHTSKIKIWVPVLGSILMTSYYMYTIHARAAAPAPEVSQPAVQAAPPAAVAVVEEPGPAKPGVTPGASSAFSASVVAGGDDDSDSDLLKRAQGAHSSQQFGEEAKYLQKAFDHSHSPQQVCPAIGKAYERAGDVDGAIRAFEQCTALMPGNVDMRIAFAHALQAKPDFKRATALYRQGLRDEPGNLDAQSGLALIELQQNHLPEAQHAAQAILQKVPDDTDALLITGIVAWRQSKLTEAEQIFSKGTGLDDKRADFHAFLGRIAEAQRRPQEALQQYEKALALDPNDSEIADRRDRLRDTR